MTSPPVLPRSWTHPSHPARVWTIYCRRRHRRRYFVQRWLYPSGGSEPVADPGPTKQVEDLSLARSCVPPGASVRLDRCPADDPEIVETWL